MWYKTALAAVIFGFSLSVYLAAALFAVQNSLQIAIGLSAPYYSSGQAQAKITQAIKEDFTIETPEGSYLIPSTTVKSWLGSYYRAYTGQQEYRFDSSKIAAAIEKIAVQVNQPASNGRFGLTANGQLIETIPYVPGRVTNLARSAAAIAQALRQGQSFASLVIDQSPPELTVDRLKTLGITALLGRGGSNFSGSPQARTNNIKIGARIFNGLIIKPGEEFSFNQWLGPVTASTGYRAELVIKNKTLTPEYGGGLCQVSTTLFRAAFAAGLPILERHPHSLPVRYYNPQGFDATIYPGVSDLRFKNDTTGSILIQSLITGASISFEIYGSGDGRQVTINGPHIYDSQPDGSLKTWLKRIITFNNGSEKKDVFYSNYKSPSLFPTVRNPLE